MSDTIRVMSDTSVPRGGKVVTLACRVCEGEFSYEHKGGRYRHYCSDECKAAPKRKPVREKVCIECEECGAKFAQANAWHRFCSTPCKSRNYVASGKAKPQPVETRRKAEKAYGESRRAEKVAQAKSDGTYRYCAECAGDMPQHPSRTHCGEVDCRAAFAEIARLRTNERNLEYQRRHWERTGMWSSQRYKDRPYNKDYNYRERHPDRAKHYDHIRRAREANCERESFPDSEIFERDGFMCGICGESVDMEVCYPDAMSASLDHIVPLSRGGGHVRSNVRLAHMGCNARKNARLDEEFITAS